MSTSLEGNETPEKADIFVKLKVHFKLDFSKLMQDSWTAIHTILCTCGGDIPEGALYKEFK